MSSTAFNCMRARTLTTCWSGARDTGIPVRWVNATLVFPFAWIDVTGEPKQVAVLNQSSLLRYINRRSTEFDRGQIESYVAALERIAMSRPLPRVAAAPSTSTV